MIFHLILSISHIVLGISILLVIHLSSVFKNIRVNATQAAGDVT